MILRTFLVAAAFLLFAIVATFFGLFAWGVIILALAISVIVFAVELVVAIVRGCAEISRLNAKLDPYRLPHGDVPKVPHGG